MKKTLLFIALLCAFAQGAWAQSVWDGHTSTCPSHYSTHWNGDEWVLNTIQIYSADELAYIRDHWTDSPDDWVNTDKDFSEITYELYADLDMTAANWTPMGSADYTGAFYGNGHTIRYKIDDSSISSNYQGLFNTIGSDGSVKDLHVDCYIKVGNASNVAGICGENEGTIENCWVSGHIESNHYSAYDADLGGIAGLNDNSGTTKYCCVTADIKNTNGNSGVGGIAGSNEGTIQHVTFYGSVSVDHVQDNKWVGDQDGTLENYYDTFNQDEYNAAIDKDIYSDAILHPYAIIINSVGNGVIVANPARTYPDQTVTLTVTSGLLETITIKDSNGNNVSYSGNAASGFTFTIQHYDIIVTTQFDTTNWDDENLGTENNPYIIDKNDEWTDFVNHVNNGNSYSGKYIKLTANISVNSMAGSYQSDDNYQPFSGTFDGDGHTLTINLSNQSRFGAPFKCVEGATIKNLLTVGTINGGNNADGKLLAGLVGVSFGNTTITGCRSHVTLTTNFGEDAAMAGFVAGTKGGSLTVSDCVFDGSMTGSSNTRCAGIAGYEYTATTTIINNCLFAPATLTVSIADDGFTKTITRDPDATITNCYYTQALGTPQGWLVYATEPSVGFYISSVMVVDGNTYYRVIGTETGNQSHKTYQISEDMEIPSRIIARGNVTLNLGEGTTLHAPKGIDMSNGSSLTINGPGTITIDNCDDFMAGIGLSSIGVLTINSGVVNVTGGEEEGAGIGGNNLGNGSYVIIHGGVVNATGGWGGAGIGGNNLCNGGNVTIHGGVVNAVGGEGGPGIGSGADFRINESQNHPCGDVVITGGQVTAIGNKVYGIGPGAAHVGEYHNGTLQLSWTNPDDFVFISTASAVSYTKRTLSSITFTNGKQFYLEHAAAIATESNLYGYKLLPYTGTLPSLAGTGTAETPFLINNHDDWLLFYWYVNSGTNSYSGQYVKLMADLTITTTVGLRDDKPFSGTFLGNGHTLTANLTGTIYGLDVNNEQGTAPFHYIKNATIKDLTIAGDTYSTSRHAGGLVGFADGTNLIEGCIVTSTLHLSNEYAGGIIAHGLNSTTTLRDCVFAGTITSYYENPVYDGDNVIEIGGIWGWGDNGTPTLVNCLEKGSFNNIKSMHPIGLQGDKGTITNCYYVNQQIGSPTNACTVSGAYKVENSLSGLCKQITIEGFTVYSQSCTVSGVESNYIMTESPINVDPVMTDPFGTTLNFGTNYTVTLDGESVEAFPISISTKGSHTLVFTGIGSYVGTKSVETYLLNSINGTGMENDPYIISNTDEWNTFAYYVNSGTNKFNGKYVKLTADISVTEMVGTSEGNSFQGTFLGDGVHTLTFTQGTSESAFNEQNCAPFRYVKNATIRDLKVNGNIYSSQKFAGGVIARSYGTTSVTDCLIGTNIYSTVGGDGTHGGIVAFPGGTLTIEGCTYTGRMLTNNGTHSCGGFVGWHNGVTINVSNSLYAPSGSIPDGWTAINGGATFVRGGNAGNNCYYTETLSTAQGLPGNVRTITGYGSENNNWAFIASPLLADDINPTTIEGLIGSGTAGEYNYDLFRLNIEYERWENYVQHTDGFVIANGTGYLYAKQSDVTLTFTGTYNIDNTKEVNLQQGFNLVGNPFPRAAWVDRSYYKMNSTGTDIEVVENYAENHIEPCYGIVVRAENANESIMFRTSAPQQQSSANNGNLQMTLTKAGVRSDAFQDKAIVSFNEGSQLEKFVFNEKHAKLYIPQYGEDYAIAFSDMSGEVPLNFKTRETGHYTIGFNFENVKGVRIQLIDKIEDRIIDLNAIDSYTFMGSSIDRDDRFTLVFTQVEVDGIFAYQSGNDIIVSGEGELQVFDVMGRMVMNQYINGVQTVEKPSTTGVYIFRLNGMSQKIVVR